MLSQITVSNVAIADHVELTFAKGMTVITGETGAGKSIVLDALGLTLGDRADSGIVRHGEERADISAVFDITRQPDALDWLKSRDLDNGNECILRRVITKEGRSRGYINGQPVALTALKEVGEMLINIHSQHEHQSLLRKDSHRQILDSFSQQTALAVSLQSIYKDWSNKHNRLKQLTSHQDEQNARLQLLRYQVQELDQLNLGPDEINTLELEQQALSHAEHLLSSCHRANEYISEGEPAIVQMLSQAISVLDGIPVNSQRIDDIRQMLSQASIHAEEAGRELRQFVDTFDADPAKLAEIEERLGLIYQLARKHRISPEDLPALHKRLQLELEQLEGGDQNLEKLEAECQRLQRAYLSQANQLSQARANAAQNLAEKVMQQLKSLHMNSVVFQISLTPIDSDTPQPFGMEDIEFLVSTNPGQPPRPLNKVASGGELSRISLAIQVIAAQTSAIQTLVFDEVDVGIGGATAEVVGQLLRQLGKKGQVLCVTHLPQVASCGHTHLLVKKTIDADHTQSRINQLTDQSRIDEIARMLGGLKITPQTLAHAQEMLAAQEAC